MKTDESYAWMDTHVNRMINLGSAGSAAGARHSESASFQCGQILRFRLSDVYAPGLADLFNQITPELELQGRISFLSDGGDLNCSYAVVEVPGILLPLIVPVSCLEIVVENPATPTPHRASASH
jgi:hypothetical protein